MPKQAAQVLLDILLSLLMSPYVHYASFSQSLVYHVDGLIEHNGDNPIQILGLCDIQ
jgi:hypothetical protein